MSSSAWETIKTSKFFYVSTYRRIIRLLVYSMLLNLLLGLGIYYKFFHQPEIVYYSTDGVTAPVKLTALDEPNNTSTPLLASDSSSPSSNKVIPQ